MIEWIACGNKMGVGVILRRRFEKRLYTDGVLID
jgi:hypothetical protein